MQEFRLGREDKMFETSLWMWNWPGQHCGTDSTMRGDIQSPFKVVDPLLMDWVQPMLQCHWGWSKCIDMSWERQLNHLSTDIIHVTSGHDCVLLDWRFSEDTIGSPPPSLHKLWLCDIRVTWLWYWELITFVILQRDASYPKKACDLQLNDLIWVIQIRDPCARKWG